MKREIFSKILPLLLITFFFAIPVTAQITLPNVVNGYIKADGEGIEGIEVTCYNHDTDLTQKTKTAPDGYFQFTSSSSFPINEGNYIEISFAYNGEEFVESQNAKSGVTTFEFEVEEEQKNWAAICSPVRN